MPYVWGCISPRTEGKAAAKQREQRHEHPLIKIAFLGVVFPTVPCKLDFTARYTYTVFWKAGRHQRAIKGDN